MKIIYIITALILNFSCADNRKLNPDGKQAVFNIAASADTLKFKMGIRSILQDSKGNYWFGSDQEGLCRYDGKTFTYYTPENGFCGKQVISIWEDETGLVWFGTSSGLCYFDGEKFHPVSGRMGTLPVGIKPPEYSAWTISPADHWFAGSNGQLIRVEKGKSAEIKNPVQVPANGNPGDYGITGFSKDKMGGLWIAYYKGAALYDGNKVLYINDSTMQFDGESKYMHVRSVLADSKSRVWIGNNGIGVLLKEGDSVIHFSEKLGLFKGKLFRVTAPPGTLMHVFAIREDSNGNIWFGDRDTGAWRYDGKEVKNFVVDSALNTQHIWDIYEDKNKNLLFAMGARGVYRFNGQGFDRVL